MRRASCVRGSDWPAGWERAPQRRAAPGSFWRREKAQLGRQRAPSRAGRADDVMWSNTGGRLQLRADWHLKAALDLGPAHYCVCVCVVVGAEAQKPGGWLKRWVDVNRCPRWDALPSQCGGGGGGGGGDGAGERERERGWMLKIYCVCSHIDSFAFAILATPPMHPRRCGRFKDDLTLCVRYQWGSLLRLHSKKRGAIILHPWHHRLFQVHFLPSSCFHLLHFIWKAVGAVQSWGKGPAITGSKLIKDGQARISVNT